MFKSCNYCRHRKKKCILQPASNRCADCQYLGLACEFSPRHPSEKRRQTSQKIASQIGLNGTKGLRTRSKPSGGNDGDEIDEANLKEGDCQLRLAGKRDMAKKRLFQPADPMDGQSMHTSPIGQYCRHVHPFWPFVAAEYLAKGEIEMVESLQQCIDSAVALSLNCIHQTEDAQLHANKLFQLLNQETLSMPTISGALLLCFFLDIEDDLVQKASTYRTKFFIFETTAHAMKNETLRLPTALVSGTFVINVWRRLAGHAHSPLDLSPDILESYSHALDTDTFGHHFLRLSRHAAELDQRCTAINTDGVQPDSHLVWAKLEYDCFLWQVCLPSTLLDTRDDLPATPGSVVIHCLSNLLLLSFYSFVLEHADSLGSLIALRPVPGVLLFMCALARSTFICPRVLLDRMSLLISIQAQTARIMLRVWHQTGYENCRAILNLWEDPHDLFPELFQQIRTEIGPGPWAIEEIDGYSVFWTFRDLRTLTTKFIFTGRP
ncbi:hypothetical protein BU24DRAFT_463191 [Aaosphaeria arxii CBS 175.79]|uniref:Zn(2)-C6 fungal-type domain-containing protein n=1 Tax=Aaosphaeria arxii CBS 175.79 TaxID=1450172 RepID=A0A6A5XMC9_9PLEO|nr:uncharacterized protein BU24DRAFT_463191 [Aaosphaeria arxii CBS 175.79]KAF2014398.1 hypothetical protein BU24DRAFT_463191 [Aaosphaeria arxii CBS 175.79]